MNVNKKFDRFRQWGKEKMGAEAQTTTSQDFKALEAEMTLRQSGMERLHSSMNAYIKSLSRRTEGDSKDKQTPLAHFASTMTKHGEDFDDASPFGACLLAFGQTHERLARLQDGYSADATATWFGALERSSAQMKDYQKARKMLDSRRLAYDTSQAKLQKAKRDDYRAEDEVRAQKAKYEESSEDVYRRMQDIVEAENDNVAELYSYLEAELTYYERVHETLMQLKQSWPLEDPTPNQMRRNDRSRTNTLNRVPTNSTLSEDLEPPPTMPFRIGSRASSGTNSPRNETNGFDFSPSRNDLHRSATADNANGGSRPIVSRTATDISNSRGQLRPTKIRQMVEYEQEDDSPLPAPNAAYEDSRSSSPAPSFGTSNISRNTSWSTLGEARGVPTPALQAAASAGAAKKAAPPPPPPSRATKPKPPPPPMKRSGLSTGSLPVQ